MSPARRWWRRQSRAARVVWVIGAVVAAGLCVGLVVLRWPDDGEGERRAYATCVELVADRASPTSIDAPGFRDDLVDRILRHRGYEVEVPLRGGGPVDGLWRCRFRPGGEGLVLEGPITLDGRPVADVAITGDVE